MKVRNTILTTSLIALLGSWGVVTASGDHEGHHEEMKMPAGESMKMSGDHGGHMHSAWIAPPADYADKHWTGWDEKQAGERGKAIYQQRCAYCHGADGKGTGPLADRLEHKPADLTNNFHTAPGKGDAYLFWRITEGGTAEPFRSQKSAMPAFAMVLDESQRWDVLTYVHQQFHSGFPALGGPQQKAMPDHHDGVAGHQH